MKMKNVWRKQKDHQKTMQTKLFKKNFKKDDKTQETKKTKKPRLDIKFC